MLRVVEDEEELEWGERRDERLEWRLVRCVGNLERVRDGRDDERRVSERRELDEPGTVRVGISSDARGLQREPRLTAATSPRENEQPWVTTLEQRAQLGELTIPADQEVRWRGQGRSCRRSSGPEVQTRVVLEDAALEPRARSRPRLS
jgi:hypothetical protein